MNVIIEIADKMFGKESKYGNIYHSKFINYRDREILKYYIKS